MGTNDVVSSEDRLRRRMRRSNKIAILFRFSCFPLGDCSLLTPKKKKIIIMGCFIPSNLTTSALF